MAGPGKRAAAAGGSGNNDNDPPGQEEERGQQGERGQAAAGAAAAGPSGGAAAAADLAAVAQAMATMQQQQAQLAAALQEQRAANAESQAVLQQAIAQLAAGTAVAQQGPPLAPNTGDEMMDHVLGLATTVDSKEDMALLVRCANALYRASRVGNLRPNGTMLTCLYSNLTANPNLNDTVAVAQAAQQAQSIGVQTSAGAGAADGELLWQGCTAGGADRADQRGGASGGRRLGPLQTGRGAQTGAAADRQGAQTGAAAGQQGGRHHPRRPLLPELTVDWSAPTPARCTAVNAASQQGNGAGPSQPRRAAGPPAVITGTCHRCGRTGHWRTGCYASTDVNGQPIIDGQLKFAPQGGANKKPRPDGPSA